MPLLHTLLHAHTHRPGRNARHLLGGSGRLTFGQFTSIYYTQYYTSFGQFTSIYYTQYYNLLHTVLHTLLHAHTHRPGRNARQLLSGNGVVVVGVLLYASKGWQVLW
jgi:hypothetical protein